MGDIKITCKVEGGAKIADDLRAIGPKIARKLFRKALRAVGDVWTEEAKGSVPVDSGDLRDSIQPVIKVRRRGNEYKGTVDVGPTRDTKSKAQHKSGSESPAVYGMFVEFGLKQKKYKFTPFMRPTFDGKEERIIQLFAQNLKEDLEDAINGPDEGEEIDE
jgi:HK97 gp10 family phage protein